MSGSERYECLVLGGGNGGMYLAWHMARSGRRTAVIERRWIGGPCPNINCLPIKKRDLKRESRRPDPLRRQLGSDDALRCSENATHDGSD